MTKAEIITAFATAELSLFHDAPITEAEKATFAKALAAVRVLPAAERIAIRAEIGATVAACVGKAA